MRVLSRLMTYTNVNYTFRVIKHVPKNVPGSCVVRIFMAENVLGIKEQRGNGSFS